MKNHKKRMNYGLGVACWISLITAGFSQPIRTFSTGVATGETAPRPRNILYLGRAERVFHNPVNFYLHSARIFAERGLKFTFTDEIEDLNLPLLSQYDGLFMYGDVQTSGFSSEVFGRPYVNAIVDYVEAGGGLTGMHVAAACFRNSTDFGSLLGGRFLGHFPYQSFSPNVPDLVSHPVTEGLGTYTSSDEPYQIKDLNPDVILLGTRDGIGNEADDRPYTWVRTQGAGKVFYHANGHDASTWDQPNFQELMLRGTEWVASPGSDHLFGAMRGVTLTPAREVSFVAEVEVEGVVKQGVFSGNLNSPHRASLSGETLFDDGSAGAILNSPETSAVLVGAGMVAITSKLEQDGVSGDSAAFLFGPPQCPHLIAASGMECPEAGAGITYAGVKQFAFETSDLDEVVLKAALDNPNAPLRDTILLKTNGNSTAKVLMEGDVLQGGSVISDLTELDFSLSDSGLLTLICEITENGTPAEAIISDRSGTLGIDLQTGVQYAGLPNGVVIEGFEWVEIRDSGDILFLASLAGTDVTSSNNQALYRLSTAGDVVLMMREGDLVNGGVIEVPVTGWKLVCSESHLAVITSYVRSEETQAVPALVLVSNTSASVVLVEDDLLVEENESLRVKFIPGEKASCEADESIIKVTLESEMGSTSLGEAILLLGRLQPRILVRAGWQIPTETGSLLVEHLDFEPDSHGQSGHSLEGGVAFLASGADGIGQVLLSDLSDSLDGDLFHDDLEIAFGGDPDSASNVSPEGVPKIQANPDGTLVFNFWASELFLDSYEIFESEDLKVWTKIEAIPNVDSDQSGVTPNFQRFHYQIEALSPYRFFRIQLTRN